MPKAIKPKTGKTSRGKGQRGEREVVKLLTQWYNDICLEKGLPPVTTKTSPFQRNQNQTATGGSDVSNLFGLDIEVKRQETLNINQWWEQVNQAASDSGGNCPILMYRQNGNKNSWKIRMWGSTRSYRHDGAITVDLAFFEAWFKNMLRSEWWKVDA